LAYTLPKKHGLICPIGLRKRLEADRKASGGTLRAQNISYAFKHKSVEEIWYFLGGEGQVWRKLGEREKEIDLRAGFSLTIPTGAHFQFRTAGTEPLCFIIATIPPWRGAEEAVRVEDHWPTK
jgi:mannose-6-phosphate isomerase-like protein (cupin superfamily)